MAASRKAAVGREVDALIRVSEGTRMLTEAKSAFEAIKIAEAAEAYRYAMKVAGASDEAQRQAAELKLRAERRAGELLRKSEKATGARQPGTARGTTRSEDATASYSEQGIDKRVAARCQKIASIPDEKFEEFLSVADEVTTAGAMRIAREIDRFTEPSETPDLPDHKFRVLYADPPWQYGNAQHSTEEQDTTLQNHYPVMADEELLALEVESIADDDAVLFCWATSPRLPFALDLIRAWGFAYKSLFVWDKIKHNVGYYNSVRHEFLLICTRGSCLPDNKQLHDSVVSIERTDHSVKPPYFRELIDRMYPNGRRIELFARGSLPAHWDAWGNES
ncbi:MAG: MT-A70 family methyltransferase [bacterium]|jgi:N6-adenosine-specific RNA methylase IME4